MSWICPTCGQELGLWQSECPRCVGSPQEEHSHVGHEVPASEPELEPAQSGAASPGETHTEEGLPAEPRLTKKAGGVPWVAYVVMVAALATLVVFLWPTDQVNLRVETEPPGATVLVDGEQQGRTPLELSGLTDGYRYELRVELQGYEPYEETFVAHSQKEPWRVTLERSHNSLLDEEVVRDLVGQMGESARTELYSDELAQTLFTVNPLIEQNPWLTERTWTQIFREVVDNKFGGDEEEFLRHLQDYKAELARGKTSKQAWYQHVHQCEKVCRPVVTEVFKRHLEWLRRTGFAMVFFPINRYQLTDEDTATVGDFIEKYDLAENRNRQILLVGRASRIGGQQYNLELSRKRVNSVREELASQLPDGSSRVRTTHLGFEPPQVSASVAKFLGLDASLSEQQLNQSVMLIVSEPLPTGRRSSA